MMSFASRSAAEVSAPESGDGCSKQCKRRRGKDGEVLPLCPVRERASACVVVEGREVLRPGDGADQGGEAVQQEAQDGDAGGAPGRDRLAARGRAEREGERAEGEPQQ